MEHDPIEGDGILLSVNIYIEKAEDTFPYKAYCAVLCCALIWTSVQAESFLCSRPKVIII